MSASATAGQAAGGAGASAIRPLSARHHVSTPRRLVRCLVLVEQDERGRWHERRQERRARAGREPRRPRGERRPGRRARGVADTGVEPDHAVELREPLGPARRGLDVGRDDEDGPGRALDALERPPLASGAHEELRLRRGRGARGAPSPTGHSAGVAERGRKQRGAGRADRREALGGDPADQLELRRGEHGPGVGKAEQRLERRVCSLAERHDHPGPLRAAQTGHHALAGCEGPAVRHAIGERVSDRGVEGDVRDHLSEREAATHVGGLRQARGAVIYRSARPRPTWVA